ncbi:hypothetical protein LC55x_5385 [Lysobacter capsici]|nr:hypothetical protein LC55x_5385 [Lysobacter capsici]
MFKEFIVPLLMGNIPSPALQRRPRLGAAGLARSLTALAT